MRDHSEAFVAIDTSKLRNAVAIAEGGRTGEVRFLGEIDNTPAATAKLVRKLAGQYERVAFCYEAGPTGGPPGENRRGERNVALSRLDMGHQSVIRLSAAPVGECNGAIRYCALRG